MFLLLAGKIENIVLFGIYENFIISYEATIRSNDCTNTKG